MPADKPADPKQPERLYTQVEVQQFLDAQQERFQEILNEMQAQRDVALNNCVTLTVDNKQHVRLVTQLRSEHAKAVQALAERPKPINPPDPEEFKTPRPMFPQVGPLPLPEEKPPAPPPGPEAPPSEK
jgi:hypothetical protein